jgi:pimeloyl-ACP methyl ester carboxylesterase
MAIESSPMTGEVTNDRANPVTDTTWITTPMTLAALTAHLDLKNAIHVGHSTGGGEVTRYMVRHGESRVANAVLISAVPPLMVKTAANPDGLPKEVFDGINADPLAVIKGEQAAVA